VVAQAEMAGMAPMAVLVAERVPEEQRATETLRLLLQVKETMAALDR
jgi:hypothetical protein